jgi:hypothetical protein
MTDFMPTITPGVDATAAIAQSLLDLKNHNSGGRLFLPPINNIVVNGKVTVDFPARIEGNMPEMTLGSVGRGTFVRRTVPNADPVFHLIGGGGIHFSKIGFHEPNHPPDAPGWQPTPGYGPCIRNQSAHSLIEDVQGNLVGTLVEIGVGSLGGAPVRVHRPIGACYRSVVDIAGAYDYMTVKDMYAHSDVLNGTTPSTKKPNLVGYLQSKAVGIRVNNGDTLRLLNNCCYGYSDAYMFTGNVTRFLIQGGDADYVQFGLRVTGGSNVFGQVTDLTVTGYTPPPVGDPPQPAPQSSWRECCGTEIDVPANINFTNFSVQSLGGPVALVHNGGSDIQFTGTTKINGSNMGPIWPYAFHGLPGTIVRNNSIMLQYAGRYQALTGGGAAFTGFPA